MSRKIDILEYRDYLRQRYGEVLHRVPIDAGFNCPHRNNDKAGGCTFCPGDGARAVQLGRIKEIPKQIRAGVRFAERRYNATSFMAYLQAFTNTFTSVRILENLVDQILAEQEFKAIAIGTRPDCLEPEVLEYLKSLMNRLDVWIELGIQTCHDKTLENINRGHAWEDSRKAILKLHKAGISIAAHIILGLPEETAEDYLHTVTTLTALPIDAIKFHNLHVVKGTALADQYARKPFPVYSEHEYCEILLGLLPHIPPHIPIIRLTTDTDPALLIAPRWSMSKGQFRRYLGTQMRARAIAQGCGMRDKSIPCPENKMSNISTAVSTDDGSITFFNNRIKEHYHTLAGARSEAENKFNNPAGIDSLLSNGKVALLDVCFGLGYNSLVACDHAISNDAELEITGLEMDRRVVAAAAEKMVEKKKTAFDWQQCLQTLQDKGRWEKAGCAIELLWGDARYTAAKLKNGGSRFDLIWLDAFSTQKNSELWTVDFFRTLFALLHPEGALLTYCAAIPVRAGLMEAGFCVGETTPFGRERGGTIASPDRKRIKKRLSEREIHLIRGIRGTPYRDPNGTRTNREILRAREFEILQIKKTSC